jgi:hypothetical protein
MRVHEMNYQIFTAEDPEGFEAAPAWKRSAILDDNGSVWVPAIIAGNERIVFLCLGYDAQNYIIEQGHVFVKAEWMKKTFPETSEICEIISGKLINSEQKAT